MGSGNKFVVLATVIIVAFVLQIVLIGADRHETPGTTAVNFSKAYFKLDADMDDLLCAEMKEDEAVDVVGDYLFRVAEEARAEGFDTKACEEPQETYAEETAQDRYADDVQGQTDLQRLPELRNEETDDRRFCFA